MIHNRFWRLDSHPEGHDFASALSLQTAPLAPLDQGEVRIRAQWLSMDAGTRMWMSPRSDGYQPPLPLGSPMIGLVLGRVCESRDPRFPEGALVRGFGQWAEYSTVVPDQAGLETVAEAIGAKALYSFTVALMDDGADTLSGIAPADIARYRASLLTRFANPALKHRLAQIAMDGSQKLPQRILAVVRDRLGRGLPIARHGLAVAAWMTFAMRGERLNDPLAVAISRVRQPSSSAPMRSSQVAASVSASARFGARSATDQAALKPAASSAASSRSTRPATAATGTPRVAARRATTAGALPANV